MRGARAAGVRRGGGRFGHRRGSPGGRGRRRGAVCALAPEEVEIVLPWLSGELRQGSKIKGRFHFEDKSFPFDAELVRGDMRDADAVRRLRQVPADSVVTELVR